MMRLTVILAALFLSAAAAFAQSAPLGPSSDSGGVGTGLGGIGAGAFIGVGAGGKGAAAPPLTGHILATNGTDAVLAANGVDFICETGNTGSC